MGTSVSCLTFTCPFFLLTHLLATSGTMAEHPSTCEYIHFMEEDSGACRGTFRKNSENIPIPISFEIAWRGDKDELHQAVYFDGAEFWCCRGSSAPLCQHYAFGPNGNVERCIVGELSFCEAVMVAAGSPCVGARTLRIKQLRRQLPPPFWLQVVALPPQLGRPELGGVMHTALRPATTPSCQNVVRLLLEPQAQPNNAKSGVAANEWTKSFLCFQQQISERGNNRNLYSTIVARWRCITNLQVGAQNREFHSYIDNIRNDFSRLASFLGRRMLQAAGKQHSEAPTSDFFPEIDPTPEMQPFLHKTSHSTMLPLTTTTTTTLNIGSSVVHQEPPDRKLSFPKSTSLPSEVRKAFKALRGHKSNSAI